MISSVAEFDSLKEALAFAKKASVKLAGIGLVKVIRQKEKVLVRWTRPLAIAASRF